MHFLRSASTATGSTALVLLYMLSVSSTVAQISTIATSTPYPSQTTNTTAASLCSYNFKITSLTTSTATFTVNEGSLVINAFESLSFSPVTIFGPTTAVVVASGRSCDVEYDELFQAYIDYADPVCSSYYETSIPFSVWDSLSSVIDGKTAVRKSLLTVLVPGQTITTQIPDYNSSLSFYQTVQTTLSGPSSVYATATDLLISVPLNALGGQPGQRCGGICGYCQVLFPTVYVYYWPVEQQDTACLTSQDLQVRELMKLRTLGLPETGSTLVSDGFTFISPSVYVAFPTISAVDGCGTLGSVHTSVTLAFAPDELSTVVIKPQSVTHLSTVNETFVSTTQLLTVESDSPDYTSEYFVFDFANAYCPPSSLSTMSLWTVIGANGNYNPLISPPAGLTMLDVAWNQLCSAAPFQGNDPPYALLPATNLIAMTTSVHVVATATSADSGSVTPSLPSSTKGTVWALTTQTVLDLPYTSDPAYPSIYPSLSDSPEAITTETTLDHSGSEVSPLRGTTDASPTGTSSIFINSQLVPTTTIINLGTPVAPTSVDLAATDPTVAMVFGQTYTLNSASSYLIAGQTLPPGAIVLVSGTPTTLPPIDQATLPPKASSSASQTGTFNAGSSLVAVDPTTPPGATITSTGAVLTTPMSLTRTVGILTFAGQTYTANSVAEFTIGNQTLTLGGVVTVSGTPISLGIASTATDVVIGSSTQMLGGVIISMLNTPVPSILPGGNGNGSLGTPFMGGGERMHGSGVLSEWMWVVGLWVCLLVGFGR